MKCNITEFTHRWRAPTMDVFTPWGKLMHTFSPRDRQRLTLTAAGLGFVVVLLDVSAVNVALETLRTELHTDMVGLQWVVNAYTLVFASLLLSAGALGDRFGARRIFVAGLLVFTLASLACGLAPTLAALIAARLVQGLGAALLVPASLAMLQQAYPDQAERSRAVGWWGAAGGIALAAGPVLGGILVNYSGWRSIFLINLPIGAVALALAMQRGATQASANANPPRGLDLPGQMLAILALAALASALTGAGRLGWLHPLTIGQLFASAGATAAFIRTEAHQQAPMLPLALFRNPVFSVMTLSGVIVNFAYYGLVFVFSRFFQSIQHFSAQQTGLAFLPMTAVLVFVNVLAGRLLARCGPRALMLSGLALAGLGYALLSGVRADSGYSLLGVPMLLAGSGVALTVPTMTNAILSAVDTGRSGIASGILNAARQTGGMLGVAVFGYFVRDTAPGPFMAGMHLAIVISVLLLALGLALNLFGLGRAAGSARASA
jgi:DHA2 family methylenomycin A resistance protein-like MFS transporter